jgi:hypothetical protein
MIDGGRHVRTDVRPGRGLFGMNFRHDRAVPGLALRALKVRQAGRRMRMAEAGR